MNKKLLLALSLFVAPCLAVLTPEQTEQLNVYESGLRAQLQDLRGDEGVMGLSRQKYECVRDLLVLTMAKHANLEESFFGKNGQLKPSKIVKCALEALGIVVQKDEKYRKLKEDGFSSFYIYALQDDCRYLDLFFFARYVASYPHVLDDGMSRKVIECAKKIAKDEALAPIVFSMVGSDDPQMSGAEYFCALVDGAK